MSKDTVRNAAQAMAKVYVFYAVIGALENGTISGGDSASKSAQKIIAICKAESGRQLTIYDREVAAIRRALKDGI